MFHHCLRELSILSLTLGADIGVQAEACGVSLRTFRTWDNRTSLPRGYNRRRDVLRDLARFVAEKAGES